MEAKPENAKRPGPAGWSCVYCEQCGLRSTKSRAVFLKIDSRFFAFLDEKGGLRFWVTFSRRIGGVKIFVLRPTARAPLRFL